MPVNRITNCFIKSLTALAMLISAPTPGIANAEGGPDRITAGLPGGYESSRIFENAHHVEVTRMRPATSVAASGDILYLVAGYSGRGEIIADFDALFPDNYAGYNSWQIVLRTPDAIHWLRGECEITADQFRDVYAAAVDHAADGGTVEYAHLCQCGKSCSRVAVDR